MSEAQYVKLVASSRTPLTSELDISLLIEELADLEYDTILKAKNLDTEFVTLIEKKRNILLNLANVNTRTAVEMLATTLFIRKTMDNRDIMFTRTWFALYDKMQKSDMEEDTIPFIIENLENLQTVLRWAMKKWVNQLEQMCTVIDGNCDFRVFELVEIASMVDMYDELRVNHPGIFDIDTSKVFGLFNKTIHNLLFKGESLNMHTILFFHTHPLFKKLSLGATAGHGI